MQASAIAAPETGAGGKSDDRAGKYLAFHLGHEEFAIQVLKVREIMGLQEVTAVPQTPACVKGVINLRGKVIPVVDLRLKFGLPAAEYTQRTCIIVVQMQNEAGATLMGIIAPADIEDTPDFGQGVDTPYLLGMAKSKDKVKILLDINEILSANELTGLRQVLQS